MGGGEYTDERFEGVRFNVVSVTRGCANCREKALCNTLVAPSEFTMLDV